MLRYGALNRGGAPDARNSLTPTLQDIASISLTYYRHIKYGRIGIGLGVERFDDEVSGQNTDGVRVFLEWRSAY